MVAPDVEAARHLRGRGLTGSLALRVADERYRHAVAAKSAYWADQAEIQGLGVAGWIARAEGRNDEALRLLRQAAEREDGTEKHPVTPGAIHGRL